MVSTSTVQEIWSRWRLWWGHDFTAIATAILLTQIAFIILRATSHITLHFEREKSKQTKVSMWIRSFFTTSILIQACGKLALAVDAAIQYPFLIGLHPLVPADTFGSPHLALDMKQIVAQVVVLLATSTVLSRLVIQFYTAQCDGDASEAVYFSTQYIVTRLTLFIGVTFIQGAAWLDPGDLFGSIHFVSLWVWLVVRNMSSMVLAVEESSGTEME